MGVRFPNRVGESGTYVDGTPPAITLTGAALTRLRTFGAAATGGAIATNDTIGLAIEHATDPDIWQVWTATWTGSGLVAVTVEDQSGVLVDGDSIEVRAVVTAATLDAAYAPTPASEILTNGPDFWDFGPSDYEAWAWDSDNSWYTIAAEIEDRIALVPTAAGASAGWPIDFRPSAVSVDLYLPVGFSSSTEYASLRVFYGPSFIELYGDYVGSGRSGDTWVTMTCDLTPMDDDISELAIVALSGSGDPPDGNAYRLRNIVFTP